MVNIIELKRRLADGGDWALFDSHGEALGVLVPPDIGPATLLVAPVTDAVKTTTSDGLVNQSLNRDDIWAVQGLALNRVVVDRLDREMMTLREIYDAVVSMRIGWQVKKMAEI